MNILTRVLRRELGRRILPLVTSKDSAGSLRDLGRMIGSVGSVIDVGASDGRWARMAERAFPTARFLLVEANQVHRPALLRYCRRRPDAQFAMAAATVSDGPVAFDGTDPFGGRADPPGTQARHRDVPGRAIGSLVIEHDLPPPHLVKLDTHGHEREILQGMGDALDGTAAIVVEVYNPATNPDLPPFWEICAELVAAGFDVADLTEPLYRPSDGTFLQADLVMVRRGLPEHPVGR